MTAEFVGVGRVSGSASKVSSLELLICLAGAQRAVTQFIFTAFAVFQMNSLALALFCPQDLRALGGTLGVPVGA